MHRAVAVISIATRIEGVRHTVLPGAALPADMDPAEVDEMLAIGAARLAPVAAPDAPQPALASAAPTPKSRKKRTTP